MSPPFDQLRERLTTERLLLRIPETSDGPAVAAGVRASLAELKPWLPWATDEYAEADGELWCRRSRARFLLGEQVGYAIFDRATGDHLGGIGPHVIDWKIAKCEIGYWMRTTHAGRGLMSEALAAVVEMLGAAGLRRIEVRCDVRNIRSAAVARRCGFDHEGTLRCDSLDPSGSPRSTMIFSRILGTVDSVPVG